MNDMFTAIEALGLTPGALVNSRAATAEELRELVMAQHEQLVGVRREISDLKLLISALETLLDTSAETEPFAAVFSALKPLFKFSHALVLVDDGEATQQLRCVVATAPTVAESRWTRDDLLDRALRGRVIATVAHGGDVAWPLEVTRRGLSPDQPALYLPLRFRDQRGVMMLLRPRDADGYDRRDVAVARKLSLLASQALATRQANRIELERRSLRRLTEDLRTARDSLTYRANHDALTGLVNRTFFADEVRRAIRGARPDQKMALVFIDLDGFKQVNDYYGHAVGDELLIEVATRLRRHGAGGDVLARVSGDEFIALVNSITGFAELETRLIAAVRDLREPFEIGGRPIRVSASVGISLYPDHGTTYGDLRRHADLAMFAAKSESRGTTVVFEEKIAVAAAARQRMEQELRRAVAEGRFRAAVQPKVDLATMRVVGFEILARQVDEEGRMGSSAPFVNLAIQVGLLDEITDLVLSDALRSLPALDAVFGTDTLFSVNVSTRQATDPVKLGVLLGRLRESGYAQRFTLEVTEDALLAEEVFRREISPLVASAGVGLSIDDFGTGYASLSRLLTISADEIKIDRSFITEIDQRPRSRVMLRAMDTIGADLSTTVVAEGIETAAELNYLRDNTSVRIGQGYLFARPAAAEALVTQFGDLADRLAALRATSGLVAQRGGEG